MSGATIRPMREADESVVRAIYHAAHPGWPEPARWHFVAYPTLVAVEAEQPVGFTSFSLAPGPAGLLVAGQDVCVHPVAQGQGVGGALHRERCAIGRSLGATRFQGATQPDNKAMLAIFDAHGLHACHRIPAYFPGGGEAIVYTGGL